MKKVIIVLLCVALVGAFALSSCKKKDDQDKKDETNVTMVDPIEGDITAMGRYVESEVTLPKFEGNDIGLSIEKDGTMSYYVQQNEGGYVVSRYSSKDGAAWEREDYNFLSEIITPETPGYVYDMSTGLDGNIYVFYQMYEGEGENTWSRPCIGKIADTKLETIVPESWDEKKPNGQYKIIPNNVSFNAMGELFADDYSSGAIYQYSPGDYKLMRTYELNAQANNLNFAVTDGRLACLNMTDKAVEIFDTQTGEKLNSVPYPDITYNTSLTWDDEGALYLFDPKGAHRLAPGGSMWETIIDGELCSMSMPSLFFSKVQKQGDDYLALYGSGDSSAKLMRYSYDEKTPSAPADEINVYSLYDNQKVRQAIGEYQRINPNVKVSLKTGKQEEDTGVTDEDLIRTLNTQILAGKGPDILLLSGLPAKSYIEKGVLMDISDVVQPMLDSKELMANIITPFAVNGGYYSIPTSYQLPYIIGDESAIKSAGTLEELADLAVSYKKDGKQLLGIIGDNSPGGWFEHMLFAGMPAIVKDGAIDQAALAKYLTSVKKLSEGGGGKAVEDFEGLLKKYAVEGQSAEMLDQAAYSESLMNFAYNDSHAIMGMLVGVDSVMYPFGGLEMSGHSGVAIAPAMAPGVFIPKNEIGINASTKNPDICKEFLKLMLSESVQDVDLSDGFPVNAASLEKQNDVAKNVSASYSSGERDRRLEANWPTKEKITSVTELCKQLQTPSTVDKTLGGIIKKAAAGFFDGTQTAEQAAQLAAQSASAYLAQ